MASYSYTLTRPLSFVAAFGAPIASFVPSLLKDTDHPDKSPPASPSISPPIWFQDGLAVNDVAPLGAGAVVVAAVLL